LLYVALGLAAVDALVARFADVWRAYEEHPYREKLRACRAQPWDLVIVGGSPAAYALDPAVLAGLRWQGQPLDRVFNLGLMLGTTAEVYHATLRGLPTPPRLLLYGIAASDLNDDRVEPNGPRKLMNLGDAVRWCWQRPAFAGWCVRHFLDERCARLWKLYYYRCGISGWVADEAERIWSGQPPAAPRPPPLVVKVDPTECLDQLRAAGKVKDDFPFLENYRIGAYLTYLHRLLDWGQQHGVPVVLVDLPVPADLEHRCPEPFVAYRAVLADLERTRGVPILRASREAVGLTDAHFADLIHLNLWGKARLSAWVRQRLGAQEGPPR
jgi:hypothetical protein